MTTLAPAFHSSVAFVGVHDRRSLGISRYVDRLADALGRLGVSYVPREHPERTARAHLHLGNSSRRVVGQSILLRDPYLVTVHDVVPRDRRLHPVYRAAIYPLCVRRAARSIVHSAFAADLLARVAAVDRNRIDVVPHPASPPPSLSRTDARLALGLPAEGPMLAVLPGVIKPAKLVREVVSAASPLIATGQMKLLLAGRVADERLASQALASGARVLRSPDDERYAQALAAADCVLVLRDRSVGETNGPLLDAIGAGRAVVATNCGSIAEVANRSAVMVEPTVASIRAGLLTMLEATVRLELETLAAARAAELSWHASALHHRHLLEELAA